MIFYRFFIHFYDPEGIRCTVPTQFSSAPVLGYGEWSPLSSVIPFSLFPFGESVSVLRCVFFPARSYLILLKLRSMITFALLMRQCDKDKDKDKD